MRICYFHYEWDLEASTGAATQIAETVAGLERLGHQVIVVGRHQKPAHHSNGNGRAHAWLWEAADYWRSLAGVRAETAILRRLSPDVVLTLHALRFSSILAARSLCLPVVLQVNASVPDEFRRYRPEVHLLPAFSDWIERRMMRAADGVFVVSDVLRDYFLQGGIEPERIQVIPNGADPQRFCPAAADPSWRARFPGRTLVGFAGSFARFHGLDLLEHAIVETAAHRPEAHFVLAGPGAGDLRGRLHRNVTFLGHVPHERMPGMLAAMDVLVAPYAPQDFFYFSPIKLFEYMACGRAVLAARLGQIAAVIEDGHNGMLYDPGDPGDFVAKLLSMISDPAQRARLGAQARRTIQNRYTWEHNIRRIEAVLERARENRNRIQESGVRSQNAPRPDVS